jgi:hypothetical protein
MDRMHDARWSEGGIAGIQHSRVGADTEGHNQNSERSKA